MEKPIKPKRPIKPKKPTPPLAYSERIFDVVTDYNTSPATQTLREDDGAEPSELDEFSKDSEINVSYLSVLLAHRGIKTAHATICASSPDTYGTPHLSISYKEPISPEELARIKDTESYQYTAAMVEYERKMGKYPDLMDAYKLKLAEYHAWEANQALEKSKTKVKAKDKTEKS